MGNVTAILADYEPEETPDCCEWWPFIARSLQWFAFQDWPDLLAMPCISGIRVDHCPSCGADRRSCIMKRARIEVRRA